MIKSYLKPANKARFLNQTSVNEASQNYYFVLYISCVT